jgi:hypothetical protein
MQENKLKILNKVLRDFSFDSNCELIEQKTNEENDYKGRYSVFKINGSDIYLKVNYYDNSYSDNDDKIIGVEIVEPKKVIITGFEPI